MKSMKKRLFAFIFAMAVLLGCFPCRTLAANPYLPLWERVPDGEPRVFPDPVTGENRVYLYGSHDNGINSSYCSPDHVVWSAPCDDLTNWRHEGVVFRVEQLNGLPYVDEKGNEQILEIQPKHVLYAPDVVYNPVLGKYFMYLFIAEAKPSPILFVASSESPAGPFTDPHAVLANAFDPGVYVDTERPDEEGYPSVYLFYGGDGRQYACQLSGKDMYTVIKGSKRSGGSDGLIWSGVDKSPDRPIDNYRYFFEASSIRKIGKFFVLIYSGRIGGMDVGTLDYAYSTEPFGPYTYGGSIVDNRGETITNPYTGAPATGWLIGNNHGSLVEANGQWYVFYHRNMDQVKSQRHGLMEPVEIELTEDRIVIPQVEMTSQGAQADGLDPWAVTDAGTVCLYVCKGFSMHRIDSHTYSMEDWSPDSTDPAMSWNPVVGLKHQTLLGYKYFNFADGIPAGSSVRLDLSLKALHAGTTVNIYAADAKNSYADPEQPRVLIGTAVISEINDQEHILSCMIDQPKLLRGRKAIYLEFLNEEDASGEGLVELNSLQFVLGTPVEP